MIHSLVRCGVFGLCGLTAWLGFGFAGKAGDEPNVALPPARQPAALRERLEMVVPQVEFDPGPLKDVLDYLTERYGLAILIETESFAGAGIDPYQLKDQQVHLKRVSGLPVATVLRRVLAQVDADFLQQDGAVVVVPRSVMTPPVLLRRRVDALFEKVPLGEALRKLADRSGVSIVLDRQRAGDMAEAKVTANLIGVPVETAVRVLADMAGLESVPLENLLYVTTVENADRLKGGAGEPPRPMGPAERPGMPGPGGRLPGMAPRAQK